MHTIAFNLTGNRRATNGLAFIKGPHVIAYIRQRCGFKTTVTKAIQNREFNFCNKSSAAVGLENSSWSGRLTCKLIIRTRNNVKVERIQEPVYLTIRYLGNPGEIAVTTFPTIPHCN